MNQLTIVKMNENYSVQMWIYIYLQNQLLLFIYRQIYISSHKL